MKTFKQIRNEDSPWHQTTASKKELKNLYKLKIQAIKFKEQVDKNPFVPKDVSDTLLNMYYVINNIWVELDKKNRMLKK